MSKGEKKLKGIKNIYPKMPNKKNMGNVKNCKEAGIIKTIPTEDNGNTKITTKQSMTAHGIEKSNTLQV